MRIMQVVAAALLVLLALAHSYLGERLILVPLFRRGHLPELLGSTVFTRRTMRFAWHVTTLALVGLAGIVLLVAAGEPSRGAFGRVVAGTLVASGFWSLVATRGKHFSWVVFLLVGVMTWFGVR